MIDRILAVPLFAAAYLLIAPLDPNSFYLAFVTQMFASFREVGVGTSLFCSLFFCITPMLYAPEARGFQDAASGLEKTLCSFAIFGTIFGSLLATFYLLKPQAIATTLMYYASSTAAQVAMGVFGTAFALTALFAATGLLRKPH